MQKLSKQAMEAMEAVAANSLVKELKNDCERTGNIDDKLKGQALIRKIYETLDQITENIRNDTRLQSYHLTEIRYKLADCNFNIENSIVAFLKWDEIHKACIEAQKENL